MEYKVVVVGGGPTGIMAVSELSAHGIYPIAWIDPEFNCGTLSSYTELPGNTQIVFEKILIDQNSWIRKKGNQHEYMQPLQGYDDRGFTTLQSTYNVLIKIQKEVLKEAGNNITCIKGKALQFQQLSDLRWRVKTHTLDIITTYVFQCIGGTEKQIASQYPHIFNSLPSLKPIPLVQSMRPSSAKHLDLSNSNVAIFGRSHSGILVLKELSELPESRRPTQIFLFYKGLLECFVELPAGQEYRGKFYPYYGGIRGETLKWYQENMIDKKPSFIKEVEFSEAAAKEILQTCSYYVSAIGFERIPFGEIRLQDGTLVNQNEVDFDWKKHHALYVNKSQILYGMFAHGLMFPEVFIVNGKEAQRPAFSGFQETIRNTIEQGGLNLTPKL